MDELEVKAYEVLDDLLGKAFDSSVDDWGKYFVLNREIKINNHKFVLNVWSENLPQGDLLIFELRKSNLFSESVYVKGIVCKNGGNNILTQEDMWNIGIS